MENENRSSSHAEAKSAAPMAHDDDDGRVAGLRPAVDVLNDSHDLSEVPGHVPARRHTEVLHWLSTKPKSGALDDKHPHHLWQRHHRRRNRRKAAQNSALQSLMEHGSSLFGVKPDQLLDPDDLKKLLEEHTDEVVSEDSLQFLLDSMHKDAEGRIRGDEVSRFIKHVAQGKKDAFNHNHSFLTGKNGFLYSTANWGGLLYFIGSSAYFTTAVRALAADEVEGAWYNIMSLIGVLAYMLGSTAFTYLAIHVHEGRLREEKRHALDLINALIKTHAVAFELALEHAAENDEAGVDHGGTVTKVSNPGGYLDKSSVV